MKTIREHIIMKSFSSVYLLYGSEDYLRTLYKKRLKDALLEGIDEMNYSHFEGKQDSVSELTSIAETLPFFADRRVILVENSGLFKNANDLADYITALPESTVIIFSEEEVDKRSRLYKAVKERGYVCEFKTLQPQEIKQFIAGQLGRSGKRMTEAAGDYMISRCGTDLFNLRNEVEKLIAYCDEREVITNRDVDEVCTVQVSSRVFDMIDAIGRKNTDTALRMYSDILTLREKPMTILYLIIKHFNRLMQIWELRRLHRSDSEISSSVGVPVWSLKNYMGQLRNFSYEKLVEAVNYGTELEEDVKSGRINDQIGLEIMIVKFTTM